MSLRFCQPNSSSASISLRVSSPICSSSSLNLSRWVGSKSRGLVLLLVDGSGVSWGSPINLSLSLYLFLHFSGLPLTRITLRHTFLCTSASIGASMLAESRKKARFGWFNQMHISDSSLRVGLRWAGIEHHHFFRRKSDFLIFCKRYGVTLYRSRQLHILLLLTLRRGLLLPVYPEIMNQLQLARQIYSVYEGANISQLNQLRQQSSGCSSQLLLLLYSLLTNLCLIRGVQAFIKYEVVTF